MQINKVHEHSQIELSKKSINNLVETLESISDDDLIQTLNILAVALFDRNGTTDKMAVVMENHGQTIEIHFYDKFITSAVIKEKEQKYEC